MQLFLCDRCGGLIAEELVLRGEARKGNEILCAQCTNPKKTDEIFVCDRCHNIFPLATLRQGEAIWIPAQNAAPALLLCKHCGMVHRVKKRQAESSRYLGTALVIGLVILATAALTRYFAVVSRSADDLSQKFIAEQIAQELREIKKNLVAPPPQDDLRALQKQLQVLQERLASSPKLLAEAETKKPQQQPGAVSVAVLEEIMEAIAQKSVALAQAKMKQGAAAEKLEAIWDIARHQEQAGIPLLLESLQDTSPVVRSFSARVLGTLGARQAIGQLMVAIKDPEPMVRKAAAQALAEITNEEFIFFEDVPPEKWQKLQKIKEKKQ